MDKKRNLPITDFHTHILPAFDDGSRSAEESLLMLERLGSQGAVRVAATPHFYADNERVGQFLERRAEAFAQLALTDSLPQIALGAEVRYYSGISRMEGLDSLCIEGSRLLLLEMPALRWTEYTVRELGDLAAGSGLTVVLAHVERYLAMQDGAQVERLLENGVLMQINASCFDDFFQRRRALAMLKDRRAHFIGSDCHGLKHRPPVLSRAYDVIEKKLSFEFVRELVEYGDSFFFDK